MTTNSSRPRVLARQARSAHRPHGFKGAWLALWLDRLGARGHRLSACLRRPSPISSSWPASKRSLPATSCDIRDATALAALIDSARPEIVFHLAAQALVRASYREPLATFATNVQGTANVLDALRALESASESLSPSRPTRSTRTSSSRIATARPMRWAVTIPTAPARLQRNSSLPAIGTPFSPKETSPSPRREPATSSAAGIGPKTG